jgi:hypothetical protein
VYHDNYSLSWLISGKESTMRKVAEARSDPADSINAAADASVRERFELPALIALRRLAGTVYSEVNERPWQQRGASVSEKQRTSLEALLFVDQTTRESPFALLCRASGRASRKKLSAL